ncbi:hypothetical protein KC19_8G167500 [Ceratodon purpureus]|uniref:50S ribosomal protein L34, chloroplastic n=1 Tax=Ceratodon purpureus TaxID=3225 RepID=A0A8T0H322_CERPU|nr:hypothetical protein KC19_8G167500 [Ceratodon purpureus]
MAAMALSTSMSALSLATPASSLKLASSASNARCGLVSSFTSSRVVSSFSSSSFAGVALRPTTFGLPIVKRGFSLVVRAGSPCMGCTKRSRSRKSIARVSGYRARQATPTGRNVLKRRRAKGRKVLVTKSNPSSGKFA